MAPLLGSDDVIGNVKLSLALNEGARLSMLKALAAGSESIVRSLFGTKSTLEARVNNTELIAD